MHAGPHSPEIEIVHRSLHIAHVDVEGEQVDLLPSVRQSLRPVSLRQSVLCLRTGASVLRDNTSKRFGSRSRAAASGVGARSSPSMMPWSSSSPPSIGSVCYIVDVNYDYGRVVKDAVVFLAAVAPGARRF